ncbi:hypothetical protein [Bradyrhizobium sp. Ai1a-2]|uniref:hypothetical protein n=1 Tax=Bradyrhizobium sp. Ai1a-2 TaxID=196490 RepID=UPI0003F624CE|nr:hypothetical protein [Bradyrhizobium sp. Ai1a-2]
MAIPAKDSLTVERVQTGVRVEKRLLKVLKALAEYHDISLGDLLEGIVLHVFEGHLPFDADMQRRISELKQLYRLDLEASLSHHYIEKAEGKEKKADSSVGAARSRPTEKAVRKKR